MISTGHSDVIHDSVYNYYGTLVATCSSDQKISIQQFQPSGWILNDTFKAHDASILRLDFSHPEFNNILVSCSMDTSIRIWEQSETEALGNGRRWVERARITDSRGAVQGVQFAPHHLGLRIASCSSEGILRIYEALDIVNISHWTLTDDFEISSNFSKEISSVDSHYSLSWCPSKFFPASIAASGGKDHSVKIYTLDSHNKWSAIESLMGHLDLVTDVAWAPNLGKSFELIATASRDGHVRIFQIKENQTADEASKQRKYKVDCVADFTDHETSVWRVRWNVTGTILSSSGDDGKIRLWKSSFLEEWRCMTVISAQQSDIPFSH